MLIKKLASVLLASVMVLVAVPLRANATNVIVGDVNADSRVNIGDVARLYAHFQGNALVGQEAMTRADRDDDGWLYPSEVQALYEQARHFTLSDLLAAVWQLPENTSLSDTVTFTGRVVRINDCYDPDFDNISVTIKVDDSEETIHCYRMTGDRMNSVSVGDRMTVTGQLRRYKSQVEFATGCQGTIIRGISTLDAYNKLIEELTGYLPVGVAPR